MCEHKYKLARDCQISYSSDAQNIYQLFGKSNIIYEAWLMATFAVLHINQ